MLNHVPSEPALRRVLGSVRRALAPGGAFVFDALTDLAFETLWPDNTHRLDGPARRPLARLRLRPGAPPRHRSHDGVREGPPRGRYTRHETTLHEWAHDDRRLYRALRSTGFAEIWRRPWSPWADQRSR